MPLKLTTYYHGKDIPELPGKNAFHSKELFQIYEATPGYTPLLIVATEDGRRGTPACRHPQSEKVASLLFSEALRSI